MIRDLIFNQDSDVGIQMTYVATNYAASTSAFLPTGTAEGDIVICVNTSYSAFGGAAATVVPTGFTELSNILLANAESSTDRTIVSYKKMTAADITAGSVSGMTSGDRGIALVTFTPDSPISTITAGSINGQGVSSGTTATQTVTASSTTAPTIGFVSHCTGGSTPTLGTHDYDVELRDAVDDIAIAYEIQNGVTSDLDYSSTTFGKHTVQSFYLDIT